MQPVIIDEEMPHSAAPKPERKAESSAETSLTKQGAAVSAGTTGFHLNLLLSEAEDSQAVDETSASASFSSSASKRRQVSRKPLHLDVRDTDSTAAASRNSGTQGDLSSVGDESHLTDSLLGSEAPPSPSPLYPRRFQRNCRSVGAKLAFIASADGRATGGIASSDYRMPTAGRHCQSSAAVGGAEIRTATVQDATSAGDSSLGVDRSRAHSTGTSVHNRSSTREAECSWHGSPTRPQMVKSVSPAGVIRIGGRNRRKRTKYDLAYQQMEKLGPFEEEAKSVDLSKVPGSSFALELLRNPQQYSYNSWVNGVYWPVGADGRRLLLRKLRGVFWSDPSRWQQVLQANNLYRRDLFTLARVQELFKVTHLMGAETWDFLLKCTALTQKCDALSSKDLDLGDDGEVESISPRGAAQRAFQPSGAETCKSEDDLQSSTNRFYGCKLPSPGFVRKRVSCGGQDDKEISKRSRGRPRKAPCKIQGGTSEADDPSEVSPTRQMPTGLSTPTSEATSSWLPEAEPSIRRDRASRSTLPTALGERAGNLHGILDEESATDGGAELLEESVNEHRRIAASMIRPTPTVTTHDSFCPPVSPKGSTSPQELRALLGGRPDSAMLKLTAHYAFMAQFMQCCMLVEVQRSLLRIAEELKTLWPADKGVRDTPIKHGEGGLDPAARACFESLVRSSDIHMQFVQIIVQQLQRQASSDPLAGSPAGEQATLKLNEHFNAIIHQLQLQRSRDRRMFVIPEGEGNIGSDVLDALRGTSHCQADTRCNAAAEGPEAAGRMINEYSQSASNTQDSELCDTPSMPPKSPFV